MKDLKDLCRENIWNLAPYSCACTPVFAWQKCPRLPRCQREYPIMTLSTDIPDPLPEEVKVGEQD